MSGYTKALFIVLGSDWLLEKRGHPPIREAVILYLLAMTTTEFRRQNIVILSKDLVKMADVYKPPLKSDCFYRVIMA